MSYYGYDGTDWDHLSEDEMDLFVRKYRFFEEWLDSPEREYGLLPEEYEERRRAEFFGDSDEELYWDDDEYE
jgi:hypothetical protein